MAEPLSNLQNPSSQGSHAEGADVDELLSPDSEGDALQPPPMQAGVTTPSAAQPLAVDAVSPPPSVESIAPASLPLEVESSDNSTPSVRRVKPQRWSGLRELIAWLTRKNSRHPVGSSPQSELSSDLDRPHQSKWKQFRAWVDVKFPATTPDGKKTIYRRPIFWVGVGVVTFGGGVLGVSWWTLRTLELALPDITGMSAFNREGTLTIKAEDGTILLQSGPATREKLKLKEIPERLIKAFIAIEDRRFYEHRGVDYQGIFRAIASNLLAGDVVQGGSTITQQLARIVFLNQERSLLRKVREALLAQKIERELNKDQILERYLNLVYLGSGAYGVADAAWVYFSKPVDKLTLAEMATLAGLPPAPSEYSPLVNAEAAKQRRNIVLAQMKEAGVITPAESQSASAESLALKPSPPKRLQVIAPYFASYIQKELPQYVSRDALEAGGLTVETSLNMKWQKVADKVVEDAVALDGKGQGFDEAALVSIETRTGEVKAMVGGVDYGKSQFNRVTQALRQPGSTFKGLVYATAIAAGFSPYDSYEDGPVIFDGYQPNNYGRKFSGWRSMADALASSVNVVAVKVLIDVGFEPTIKMAHDMGIKSQLNPTYSLALGASEVNLLELTNAYGTIANQGKHIGAHGIRRVLNQRGDVIYSADFKPKQVLDKNSAAIATWMLQGVVQGGTGGAAALPDRPVAGKTGTSEQARDLWFIGYIPQVVTGVWMGNDDNYPTYGASSTAAYNWKEFMAEAVKEMPVEEFPKLPELDGRKGSIKAKPVQPNKVVYGMIMNDDGSVVPYNSNPVHSRYQEPEPAYDEGYSSEPESYN